MTTGLVARRKRMPADAHVEEWRELDARRNSPLNIEVTGVWAERKSDMWV